MELLEITNLHHHRTKRPPMALLRGTMVVMALRRGTVVLMELGWGIVVLMAVCRERWCSWWCVGIWWW
ncbi:hypothetical protein HanRHA438_Chr11g0512961 [Helianthus annuus]|nr:hypothetical protein HanRHA438_Chr11g0512961 [Helianthus annuus]